MFGFFSKGSVAYETVCTGFGFATLDFNTGAGAIIGGLSGIGLSLWSLPTVVHPFLASAKGLSATEATIVTLAIALNGYVECSAGIGAGLGVFTVKVFNHLYECFGEGIKSSSDSACLLKQ